MAVTDMLGDALHNPTMGGTTYAFVYASAVRSCRGDRDCCALCSVPSRSLSVVRPKPKPKRQGRYTWRTVVELHWVVVRLNEDGSESFYSRYDTEEDR